MTISVVILTLNEEINLPGALDSLRGKCDDVVVFDSFSSDRTCAIAGEYGARVEQRQFDGYASQRNASLQARFRHPWVLMLDADERVTEELWSEMVAAIARAEPPTTLFRMRRKDFLLGRWLRHSSGYPTWFGRLLRPGRVRVEREINEEYVTDGEVAYLEYHLHHFPFNRGIDHWLARHNQYSTLEARRILQERRVSIPWGDLSSRDPVRRRRALKRLAYRMPFRPSLIYWHLYLVRGGFLDGLPGAQFCRLRHLYEVMIDVKIQAEMAESAPSPQP